MRSALTIFFVVCMYFAHATHIVGGELFYDFLGKTANGKDRYRITLRIYRDCLNGVAMFDGVANAYGEKVAALITVREVGTGIVTGVYDIGTPTIVPVPKTINSACIEAPQDACLEEGTYTYTVELFPMTGGYYVVYQRCCRNNTIANILKPGETGSTYFAKIPGPEEVTGNSSARFKGFPPIFLCATARFGWNAPAFDPDGDSLVYGFYNPFTGGDPCCPFIGSPHPTTPFVGCPSPPSSCNNEAGAPPYQPVTYIAPFTAANPVDANPALTIDPKNGLITGKPKTVAQYVVGVMVKEYRNGKLINVLYRDLQFNIRPCVIAVSSDFADPEKKCQGTTVTFTNQSTVSNGTPTFKWDFGVTTLSNDTSITKNPTYTYQDTGTYKVMLITNPGNPCSDTLVKSVYAYPKLDLKIIDQPGQCLTGNKFVFKLGGNYIKETRFKWSIPDGKPATDTTITTAPVTFTSSGYHRVNMMGWHYSCKDSMVDSIKLYNPPEARIGYVTKQFCTPVENTFMNASTAELPYSTTWRYSDGRTDSRTNSTMVFTTAGVYTATLTITTTSLCDESAMAVSLPFTVATTPSPVFTVTPKVTSIFEPAITFNSYSFESGAVSWYDFGDGGSDQFFRGVHSYSEPGTYTVTQSVSNSYGCVGTATAEVLITPEFRFWMPDAFTPDFNKVNDVLFPVVMGVSNYRFDVYDRWGGHMYGTTVIGEGWDGRKKEKLAEQGVYVWRVSFKNEVTGKFEEHVGEVLLLTNP